MATDYWRKREKKWLDECKKEEKNFEKDISDIYDQMEAEIIEQIDTWINKYADANGMSMAQAKEYLSKTDIEWYARRAKYYCELAAQDMEANNKDHAAIYFSDQANAEMARYNATMKINRFDMIRSQIKLRVLKAQSNVAGSMEADLIKRAMEEYTRQAGILGDSVLDNAANAEIIARASFHGATFSERIWGAHQETLIKTLNKALSEGLILGKGVRPLTSQIAKATGVAMKKAATLLGTELCRVQIDVQKDCYKSSGFNQFTFIASPGCCPHCQENNGKHFDVRNMMSGDTAPPMHPHCRCSTAAYMERKDDEISDDEVDLFDKWSGTFEEHGLSWEEYKKRQTNPNEDKITLEDLDQLKGALAIEQKNEIESRRYNPKVKPLKGKLSKKEINQFLELVNKAPATVRKAYKHYDKAGIVARTSKTSFWSRDHKDLVFDTEYGKKYPGEINLFSTLCHETHHMIDSEVHFKGLHFTEREKLASVSEEYNKRVKKGPSASDEFLSALRKDQALLSKLIEEGNPENQHEQNSFYKKLRATNSSNGVQDTIDGFFGTRDSHYLVWGHGDGYYDRTRNAVARSGESRAIKEAYKELGLKFKTVEDFKRELRIYENASETWADVGAAATVGGPELEQIKMYLPNSYEAYLKIMENMDE